MIHLRNIECPWCQTHDDIEIQAILKGGPRAELEFICPYCRRCFKEKDIKKK
uniref:Uncharacterized protein n=1 Tax=viral metagenome TaxID=1070528 RepID=A0A6M3JIY6_9ZZZZ